MNNQSFTYNVHSLPVGHFGDQISERVGFSVPIQRGPGVRPASYTMGTGPLLGVKLPESGNKHPPLSRAKIIKYSYFITPSLYCHGMLQDEFTFNSKNIETITTDIYIYIYTGYTQKNSAVSKVNKKFISHLTRAQRTPSAAATVQVSHALPAVRFSCLLRGRGTNFQYGVAAGKGFLCAPF